MTEAKNKSTEAESIKTEAKNKSTEAENITTEVEIIIYAEHKNKFLLMTKKREIATIIIIIISNIRLIINKENIYVRHKQKEIHIENIE